MDWNAREDSEGNLGLMQGVKPGRYDCCNRCYGRYYDAKVVGMLWCLVREAVDKFCEAKESEGVKLGKDHPVIVFLRLDHNFHLHWEYIRPMLRRRRQLPSLQIGVIASTIGMELLSQFVRLVSTLCYLPHDPMLFSFLPT
jgi:hypothetical protein